MKPGPASQRAWSPLPLVGQYCRLVFSLFVAWLRLHLSVLSVSGLPIAARIQELASQAVQISSVRHERISFCLVLSKGTTSQRGWFQRGWPCAVMSFVVVLPLAVCSTRDHKGSYFSRDLLGGIASNPCDQSFHHFWVMLSGPLGDKVPMCPSSTSNVL